MKSLDNSNCFALQLQKTNLCFLQDIQKDYELQGWAHEVAIEGFAWQCNDKKGVPDKICTIDQLVIIFASKHKQMERRVVLHDAQAQWNS